jgi:RNA polymerase sigma factor (sigma-70 family)
LWGTCPFGKREEWVLLCFGAGNDICSEITREIEMIVGNQMQRQGNKGLDDAAAAELYRLHAPSILAYLRMHTSSWEEAEDVLVDVFLAALEKENFGTLRGSEQRSWLWRVARNKVVDAFRVAQRRQFQPLEDIAETVYDDDDLAPEQFALRQEEYHQLYASIQNLSTLQQQVLRMRFVHELRCAEIANTLGKSEAAVRMLLSRTLNLLRSIYEKH